MNREIEMKQSIRMAYAKAPLALKVDSVADLLTIREPVSQTDAQRFQERLTQFLEGSSLDLGRTAVVVADKTRMCDYPWYFRQPGSSVRPPGGPRDGMLSTRLRTTRPILRDRVAPGI